MDEEKIIKLIREDQFSQLGFLSDEKILAENENYLGFLYFMTDKKREDTNKILKKIQSKHGSLANTYAYLGYIASKVYSNIQEERISLSFFRKSVDLDGTDANIWWEIYDKSKDCNSFLKSLNIDFKNKEFDNIKRKLASFNCSHFGQFDFTKEEFTYLIEIILEQGLNGENESNNILIAAYYALEKYNDGVIIINNSKNVNIDLIEKYYSDDLIDLNLAISKTYFFKLGRLLKNNYGRLYVECLNEANKGNVNPTKSVIIMMAFRASKYDDVINHYKKIPNDSFFKWCLDSHLYYLMSQLYLNYEIDNDILNQVRNREKIDQLSDKGLDKAFDLKRCLYKLEVHFIKNGFQKYSIYDTVEYQRAEELFEDNELLRHYLYEPLHKELESLSDKWSKSHFNFRLNHILDNKEDSNSSQDEFIELCHLWIHNENYDDVINEIINYHRVNSPTIATTNLLGICFEKKDMLIDAFKQFEYSINLMYKYKEYKYNVFSNYLACAKKAGIRMSKNKFSKLRGELNNSLVEAFKWNPFTAKHFNILFKYYPFNLNTLDSLINGYFYLPSKMQLNDPIELPNIEMIGVEKFIDSNYKICSFSNNRNSMLMWSHYTENHKGIMVEYSFGGELPSGTGIDKVKYKNENKRLRDKGKYIFNQFLLTKNEEWAYEEEVRLLSYEKDKIYYENYDYPNHNIGKVNAKVLSITLGCNFEESKKSLILNLIKNINSNRSNFEQKILLKKAKISENNLFCLEYLDVNI